MLAGSLLSASTFGPWTGLGVVIQRHLRADQVVGQKLVHVLGEVRVLGELRDELDVLEADPWVLGQCGDFGLRENGGRVYVRGDDANFPICGTGHGSGEIIPRLVPGFFYILLRNPIGGFQMLEHDFVVEPIRVQALA